MFKRPPFFVMGLKMDFSDNQIIAECKRCGTCCRKGGPALHHEDKQILDAGSIPLSSLYTIRKGELARDNVGGGLTGLAAEIIKIKSRPDDSVCMYFNDAEMSCGIYDHRPVECRALECWNTGKIAAIYNRHRLDRGLLLEKVEWLADLVLTHEAECSLSEVDDLVKKRASGDSNAAARLMEMINYDFHLRNLVTEKGDIAPDMHDVLFGRPLADIIRRQFGVKISKS